MVEIPGNPIHVSKMLSVFTWRFQAHPVGLATLQDQHPMMQALTVNHWLQGFSPMTGWQAQQENNDYRREVYYAFFSTSWAFQKQLGGS